MSCNSSVRGAEYAYQQQQSSKTNSVMDGGAASVEKHTQDEEQETVIDKELLLSTVRDWLQIDNDLRQLNKALKERRDKKKELSNVLVDVMRNNQIDCFDVNDGQIMYKCNKVKAPLNKQHILKCLSELFKNEPAKVETITQYILETRPEKIRETVTRKIYKI